MMPFLLNENISFSLQQSERTNLNLFPKPASGHARANITFAHFVTQARKTPTNNIITQARKKQQIT